MKSLGLTAVLAVLAGCTPAPDSPAVSGTVTPIAPSAQTVCAHAYADPALNPIRDRIPFDDSTAVRAPMTYFADPGRPNAAQVAALQAYDFANRRCWDAWELVGTAPYIQQARVGVNTALAELMNNQITFGDFNRRRAGAITQMQAALEADRQREVYSSYPYGPYGYSPGGSGFSFGFGMFNIR